MKDIFAIFFLLNLVSCTKHTVSIENERKGMMKSNFFLQEVNQKKFYLDSVTAPKPIYSQLYENKSGNRILTLLNQYNNSIYFYDYDKSNSIKRVHFEKEGANGILKPLGYYIKNMDSIYVYDMVKIEIVLSDSSGVCKQRFPLKTSIDTQWSLYKPQYYFTTVNPIIEKNDNLILTGYAPFSLPKENIENFYFSTILNTKTGKITYQHKYPNEIYGYDYNWEGGYFTMAYPCLSVEDMSIYSFPVSHNLYFYNNNTGEVEIKYGGSNVAGTIQSIDHEQRRTPSQMIEESFICQDLYGPILYDSYRNVYYRFMLNAISNPSMTTPREDKEFTVILMDENFNYLGEQIMGNWRRWNWENAFIS